MLTLSIALSITFCTLTQAQSCPGGLAIPSVVFPHEVKCNLQYYGDETPLTCYSCCGYNRHCCDDGTCIDSDLFCRYPSSCCSAAYCGQTCCNSTRGDTPCGPLCAPNGYQCCDSDTGRMCQNPDFCCGDHCCPSNTFCYQDRCCENGSTGCGTGQNAVCCPQGHQCCGDGFCCPANTTCQHGALEHYSGPDTKNTCCPDNLVCGEHLCCNPGDICIPTHDTCCDHQWCGEICCHAGYHCNDGGGCCRDGQTFCPHGCQENCYDAPYSSCCSNGAACPAEFSVCVADNYCCPAQYPHFIASQRKCYAHQCAECGSECCASPFYCLGNYCKHCSGHWWNQECTLHVSPANVNAHLSDQNPCHRPHEKLTAKTSTDYSKYSPRSEYKLLVSPTLVKSYVKSTYNPPPPPPHNTSKPLDNQCYSDIANSGTADPCTVLPCLESFTQCGPDGYLDSTNVFFCDGITAYYTSFTSKGQEFLSRMQTCVVDNLKGAYEHGVTPCCSSLQVWSKANVEPRCFVNSGYCEVYLANIAPFRSLFNRYATVDPHNFYETHCSH